MPLNNYMDFVPTTANILDLKYTRVVDGIENIPEGPAIVAPNHKRFADPFVIGVAIAEGLNRPITWGAKSPYFEGDGLGHGFLGEPVKNFVNKIELVPVYRGERGAYERLHEAMTSKVDEGKLLGIFPEGSRSPDDRLYKFYQGAARLAIDFQIPIIPTGLMYDRQHLIGKATARTVFGQAINPDIFSNMKSLELTHLLRDAVQSITHQEIADAYSYQLKNPS
jgi:1-acyl-sn-glycerol-3-phosphate acyltransferase